MQIRYISKTEFDINPQMHEIVEKKFKPTIEELITNMAEDIKMLELGVDFLKDKETFYVSANMWLPGKEHIYAESNHKEFESAVSDLKEKVYRQVRAYKQGLESK